MLFKYFIFEVFGFQFKTNTNVVLNVLLITSEYTCLTFQGIVMNNYNYLICLVFCILYSFLNINKYRELVFASIHNLSM